MVSSATTVVARYLSEAQSKALPEEVAEKARLHFLDTLAAIISGSRLRAGQQALSFVASLGGAPAASVPGTGRCFDPVSAAFASAMSAHADETDDSHLGGRFHPGCAVVSAAWAVGEIQGQGGDALLRSITAGYDLGARATKALGFSAPRSGTHSTHCLGANFGAAAAAGVMAGLTAEQFEYLLSYATQQASGIAYWQRDSDHVEKAFDFGGMGARNGVFGALFVASGATGVTGSLTGDFSYLSAFAETADPEELVAGLGERFEIMHASIKKWCVGSPIQAALDSTEVLLTNNALKPAEIERVRVTLPDDRFGIVDNRDMPDVCVQHLVALMLVDGGLSFASSHDKARMTAPDVVAMRARIEALPSAELTAARPARQAIVEIVTTEGRALSHRTRAVLGTPDNPMEAGQVEDKARDLIGPILGRARTEDLIRALRDIRIVEDLRDLRPLLSPEG